jgi:hypothetical protein
VLAKRWQNRATGNAGRRQQDGGSVETADNTRPPKSVAGRPLHPHMKTMIRLLRITAAAALLVFVAGGALAADTGPYRGAQAAGWTTHRSVSRVPARVTSPHPGLTVLHRQFLDDINARTIGDALRYVPGVIAR